MNAIETILWLALNVYFEARSEPVIGQLAVVHVVMNRMENRHLTAKEVVLQPAQFTWTMQQSSYWPKNTKVFLKCVKVAEQGMHQKDFTHGATHYHLQTIHPYWADSLHRVGKWGSHIFYK